jgi:hypothetical protein
MFFEGRSKLGIAGLHGSTARGGSENQASDQSRPNHHVQSQSATAACHRPNAGALEDALLLLLPAVESAPPSAMRVRGSSPKTMCPTEPRSVGCR